MYCRLLLFLVSDIEGYGSGGGGIDDLQFILLCLCLTSIHVNQQLNWVLQYNWELDYSLKKREEEVFQVFLWYLDISLMLLALLSFYCFFFLCRLKFSYCVSSDFSEIDRLMLVVTAIVWLVRYEHKKNLLPNC